MSTDTAPETRERSPEQQLKSLIKRDINPEITALAKAALRNRQEEST